jgi:hypothetical protein
MLAPFWQEGAKGVKKYISMRVGPLSALTDKDCRLQTVKLSPLCQ